MNTIAELLAERKKLDTRIRRAVAKAFPGGSRWHLSSLTPASAPPV